MANRISTIFDFSESGGLKKLKADVAAADTQVGKMKAGFKNAASSIKANAGALAIGAGASMVAFGVKAAEQFTTLALDVEKFSKATGMSTETTSRWVEVAGDLGIETEKIQNGFVRLEKAIGGNIPAVSELGIEMVTAADGTADVSATMLQAIKALDGVTDPAKKAKLASDLFGRGFADMAELVTGDADAISKALGEVSSAKIIDQEEIAKAKKNRETIDALKDTFEDLSLTLGESVLPIMEATATAIQSVGEVAGALKLDKVVDSLADIDENAFSAGASLRGLFDKEAKKNHQLVNAFEDSEEAAANFDHTLLNGLTTFSDVRAKVLELTGSHHAANLVALEWKNSTEELTEATDEAAPSIQDLADKTEAARDAAGKLATELPKSASELRNQADAATAAFDGIRKLRDEYDALKGSLDDESSYLDLQDEFDNVRSAAEDAFIAAAEGSEDAASKARDYRQAQIQLTQKVIDYARQVDGLPPEKVTEIQAMIDQGLLAEAQAAIDRLTATKPMYVQPVVLSAQGNRTVRTSDGTGAMQAFDSGGVVQGPKGSPQVILAHAGETVLPTHKPGAMSAVRGAGGAPINITVHAGINADGPEIGRKIVDVIKQYERANGRGWRS